MRSISKASRLCTTNAWNVPTNPGEDGAATPSAVIEFVNSAPSKPAWRARPNAAIPMKNSIATSTHCANPSAALIATRPGRFSSWNPSTKVARAPSIASSKRPPKIRRRTHCAAPMTRRGQTTRTIWNAAKPTKIQNAKTAVVSAQGGSSTTHRSAYRIPTSANPSNMRSTNRLPKAVAVATGSRLASA